MPNWMLDLLFYAFLAIGIAWPFIMWMGIIDFVDKVTAKPAPPPHIDTPEEVAARNAEARVMMRKMNVIRSENGLPPLGARSRLTLTANE